MGRMNAHAKSPAMLNRSRPCGEYVAPTDNDRTVEGDKLRCIVCDTFTDELLNLLKRERLDLRKVLLFPCDGVKASVKTLGMAFCDAGDVCGL